MTPSRTSDSSVYTDAALLLEWLERDIAERGGSGRRVSKASLHFGWDAERLRAAIANLSDRRLIELDLHSGAAFGFVYIVPR